MVHSTSFSWSDTGSHGRGERRPRKLALRAALVAVALVALALSAGPAFAAGKGDQLDMYEAVVDAKTAAKLVREYDVAERIEGVQGGVRVDLVLTARQADRLTGQGINVVLMRNGRGQTVREQAEAQAAAGFQVFRSYDEPGGNP